MRQKPNNPKMIYKKNFPQNMYLYQSNYEVKEPDNFNNNRDNEGKEEHEIIDYNNEEDEEEEEYFEEENEEEEDNSDYKDINMDNKYQKRYDNHNQNKYYNNYYSNQINYSNNNNNNLEQINSKNNNIYQIENNPNSNSPNIAFPKFYRNNPIIYKGKNQNRKKIRNIREENPLKSVAQKICNIVIKGEPTKKEKNKENKIIKKSYDINDLQDNENEE